MNEEETAKKRRKEREDLCLILSIYEKGHPEEAEEIANLRDYALTRIEKCPVMETKTYCSNCEIHCYQREFREKMRKVMKYAGARLLFRHPKKAIDHALKRLGYKIRKKRQKK